MKLSLLTLSAKTWYSHLLCEGSDVPQEAALIFGTVHRSQAGKTCLRLQSTHRKQNNNRVRWIMIKWLESWIHSCQIHISIFQLGESMNPLPHLGFGFCFALSQFEVEFSSLIWQILPVPYYKVKHCNRWWLPFYSLESDPALFVVRQRMRSTCPFKLKKKKTYKRISEYRLKQERDR